MEAPIRVLKFGGSSVGSPEAIRQAISIVRKPSRNGEVRAVVISAMHGVTDQLISIAMLAADGDDSYKKILQELCRRHRETARAALRVRARARTLADVEKLLGHLEDAVRGVRLIKELSPRALDYIMSYGERLSAHIFAGTLAGEGVRCEYLDARSIIVTDNGFGAAAVEFRTTDRHIRAHFEKHRTLQVVTGFIAATRDKKTTTLGRGGSDYTASILGAALGASVIEIWTNVTGVMTADPRKVKDALTIAAISYQEAAEMSYFGAKVIHPPTMVPAQKKNIPLLIKNTFDPTHPGTTVGRQAGPASEDGPLAKGISSISEIAVLRVEGSGMVGARGVTGRLFGALARNRVNALMITQASSEHSISIAVAPKDADAARAAIEEEFSLERAARRIEEIIIRSDLSIIAVVGEGMRHRSGISGRLFQTLGSNGVNVVAIAQGSSELNISVVVSTADELKALNAVHAAFFYPERKPVNVFLLGTGLIGGMLLKQIASQEDVLRKERGFDIRVVAIGNTRGMTYDETGILPAQLHKLPGRTGSRMDVKKFVDRMKSAAVPSKVFVDCTASSEVSELYAEILAAHISIVTPNKKANSGAFAYYKELQSLAKGPGVKFLYETNVGAALPVVGTLKDLLLSGDTIIKIEAVLSGTLSYIFNNFVGDKKFSQVVREARELGYTEPDPRDDLNGIDVARKILILARETGLPLEIRDVGVKGFVSARAARAKSPDKFFEQLEKEDAVFEKEKRAAEGAGSRLRYIAMLSGGKASVSLQAVSPASPFYNLSGSDNIIAFTTKRYRQTPLVVKGPGAGVDVTAAGVFADILRTARGVA